MKEAHPRRFLSAVVLVLAAAGLGAAVAAARPAAHGAGPVPFKPVLYKVVYEGSGSYTHHFDATDDVTGDHSSFHEDATFHWNVTYGRVFVMAKKGFPTGGASTAASGGGQWSVARSQPDENCNRKGALTLGTHAGVIHGQWGSKGDVIDVMLPVDQVGVEFGTQGGGGTAIPCGVDDFWHDQIMSFDKVGESAGVSVPPTQAIVTLTAADLKQGKIIIRVHSQPLLGQVVPPDCSEEISSGETGTCTRSFRWSGTVTFTRLKTPANR